MAPGEAPNRWDTPDAFSAAQTAFVTSIGTGTSLAALARAGAASTLHRVRRGEGALLAVNLSLLAYHGSARADGLMAALVSVLAIALMYALNDLYDARADWKNPKKDRAVVAIYLEHRAACGLAIILSTFVTVALAGATLSRWACLATAGAMCVNVVYSIVLKGVPLVDVVWCGLWGAFYAAIVTTSPWVLVLVGLMTSVCHLYQTLDDRVADAANAIVTTAVRSPSLSRNVLIALCGLLFVTLRAPLGTAGALTAFAPLAMLWSCRDPRVGWLLTKVYFGVVWLYVLGIGRAAG